MQAKRLLAMLMAAILTATALTGCGADTKETTADTTTSGDPTTPVETETEYTLWQDLPKEDLAGFDFKIIEMLPRADAGADSPHGDVEELTGEAINDAIYNRNRAVEDTFNCVVSDEVTTWGNAVKTLEQCVTAGDDIYSLAMDAPGSTIYYMLRNIMLNLYDLPNLNLSNPWYLQQQVEDFTILDKLFLFMGDISYSTLMFGSSLVYNTTLAEKFDLPDIFDIVLEEQWTLDKMYEITGGMALDLNGDDQFKAEDDQFGIVVGDYTHLMNYQFTCDSNFITYDKTTDTFVDTFDIEKVSTIVEKVNKLFYDDNRGLMDSNYIDIFHEGRSLIRSAYVGSLVAHQDMEDAFTPIPYPKFDLEQEHYQSMMTGSVQVMTVPNTVTNKAAVGLIIEALSEASHGDLMDAVYEKVLSYQTMRTEKASAVLKLIHESLIVDFGYLTVNGGQPNEMNWVVGALVNKKSTDVASYYAARKNAVAQYFDDMLETFKTLGE